jgi:hypothetical protein
VLLVYGPLIACVAVVRPSAKSSLASETKSALLLLAAALVYCGRLALDSTDVESIKIAHSSLSGTH